ncbi:uncharacterized protein LOC130535567 isoform X2 [Takifugu flavidus]|uniref:uncharacterized protein LOC130535567 isoform X2 n=1 Tax=Takifugu flavidus TaxID=433684 RepID=UPI0025442DC3|nr:uncharacterized protein LOC130535567 isoform X2 [Takifugu flavidus]
MMTESYFKMQRFLKQKLCSWRLFLLWTLLYIFFMSDAAAQVHLKGEVGGNLTFRCPDVKSKSIDFFYFQKNNSFINGYHLSKDIPTEAWSNTRMDDKDRTTVHMFNLKASHEGDYECYIKYSDGLVQTVMKLSVTANYSKPQTTQECHDGLSCVVHCVSHGGYPRIRITWDVLDSHAWKLENNSEVQDPDTLMVNSSSSASFNCSSGKLRSIRCCVGDSTSDHITVCKPEDQTGKQLYMNMLITATCIVLLSTFAALIYSIYKHINREQGKGRKQEAKEEWAGELLCLTVKPEDT